jgi:hypothetical protein
LRIAVLWILSQWVPAVFVAMLRALRRHWAHVTTSAHPNAAAEYAWTVIPWLILALCLAPAVHRVLAANEKTTCICGLLVDGMTQPPDFPPAVKNNCIEMQSAVDPIRTVFNCGESP